MSRASGTEGSLLRAQSAASRRQTSAPGDAPGLARRDGIAALEFALIAPAVILLLVVICGLGLAMRTQLEVVNVARAGANYAATHGYDSAKITAAAQAATVLPLVNVGVSESGPSCVDPATGNLISVAATALCADGAWNGLYATVTAQFSYTPVMPLPGGGQTWSLTAMSVARLE